MSRETDTSSSGPQGRGGAAYPSGTPPYGSRQYPSLHPQQDAPEETETGPGTQPDEPKTETTLTTRIRINIPGSRPIPPVVMRTPMGDGDTNGKGVAANERTAAIPRPDVARAAAEAKERERAAETPQESPPEGKSGNDWFAPRKAAPGTAAGMSAGAAAVAGVPDEERRPESAYASEGQPSQGGSTLGGGFASGVGAPGAAAGGFAPGANGFAPGGAPANGSAPNAFLPNGTAGNGSAPSGSVPSGSVPNGFAPNGGPTTPPYGIPTPGAGPTGPTGPTAGPVTGGMAFGTPSGSLGGAPRMSDDTAVLTPQQLAPDPSGQLSGATLTSGIPVVPAEHRSPFPGGGAPGGASDQGFSAPDFPGGVGSAQGAPGTRAPAPAAAPAKNAKKKGRSKLTLLGVAAVVAVGGLYGAGLLMNHSEVPKGTTVLGVDIGGGTREEAVAKLDATLGKRAVAPLRLNIGGKTEELAPEKAGLSLDSQATVRKAAGSDYNPISVIGSLFGEARVAEPVIPVDDEKLTAALTDLAGVSGSATDGTIRFEPDKAVAVPGRAGKALDVNRSIIATRDAYRTQVQTGEPNAVELPVATRQPTIDQTELDRAMKEFAEPAMSGLITIRAGGKEIQFGPARSLPKILSMKPIDGKLVEVYDRNAIDQLLEGVFDGITITKGDGKQYPVSSADVAQAMQKALRGRTPVERTQTIALDPS
ncbi:hypothetical protein ACIOEX_15810 [Streptomyces sp. NPDC087850]|uniref:hypothetical protein n=1 Tax=Streptomyces sp. NPDC087850 TaxID=3365809 RepID=UPI00381F6A93